MTRRDSRSGSILVLALLVSAAAAVAGMYMVLRWDLFSRASRYLARAAEASRLGVAGLQASRVHLGADPGYGGGTYADPGDPTRSMTVAAESIGFFRAQATSTGVAGDATQGVVAELRAVSHASVGFNAFSSSGVVFDNATAGGFIRSHGDVEAVGDVDFSGTIETLDGTTVSPAIDPSQVVFTADSIPMPAVSIAQYAGWASPLLGLPRVPVTDELLLEQASLRPDSNPYGGTNAFGLYRIDAGGAGVILRDVYVLGGLVIRNSPLVKIERGFHLERKELGLASIISDSPLEIHLESTLDEAAMLFDYDGDGDLFDVHAASIEGVVFTTSTFQGPYGGTIRGAVLAAHVTVNGLASLKNTGALPAQPVAGFLEPGPWELVAGSIGKAP